MSTIDGECFVFAVVGAKLKAADDVFPEVILSRECGFRAFVGLRSRTIVLRALILKTAMEAQLFSGLQGSIEAIHVGIVHVTVLDMVCM